MSERLEYVSPEYQEQLDRLADRLVTQRRFGEMALDDTVEFPAITGFELDDTVEFPAITDETEV
jgi:hypothetical protein